MAWSAPLDAIRILEHDHKQIEMLFDQYERATPDEQPRLIERACFELEAHTRVEEETFYPAVRSGLGQDVYDLVEEALEDHGQITRLIREIRGIGASDPSVGRKFALLMDDVRYHLDEEESELFPLVRANMEAQLNMLGDALEQQRHLFEIGR